MSQNISNFELRDKCGEGDDGVVWKAMRKDDSHLCAVKILRGSLRSSKKGEEPKEASIMASLPHHPNIVKYYGWGNVERQEVKEQHCCFTGEVGAFIVMEWVDGVTLERKISESNFGRNKRRHIFKQLLEAVLYMNTRDISHGSLFLDNIMISKPQASTSYLPRLVVCDFSSACHVPKESSEAHKEAKIDKDRCQCGAALLALFSSANLNSETSANRIIQKDAFVLAKELIDVRRPVSLEAALLSPFMTENTTGEMSYSAHWNEDIVDHVASYVVNGGDMKDFENASLVCKQFFVIFQRRLLSTSQPQMSERGELALDASVDECCMWIERIPAAQTSWGTLQIYSEGDHGFEKELIEGYLEGEIVHLLGLQYIIASISETNQPWGDMIIHFHSIRGSSTWVGQLRAQSLAGYGRERAKRLAKIDELIDNFEDEKKLFLRLIARIRDCFFEFDKDAKVFLHQYGLNFRSTVDELM